MSSSLKYLRWGDDDKVSLTKFIGKRALLPEDEKTFDKFTLEIDKQNKIMQKFVNCEKGPNL